MILGVDSETLPHGKDDDDESFATLSQQDDDNSIDSFKDIDEEELKKI